MIFSNEKKVDHYNSVMNQYVEKGSVYIKRMDEAFSHLSISVPLQVEDFKKLPIEQIGLLDVITTRFAKLQDLIGSKIFPLILKMLLEDNPDQTMIDILNKLEKLGFINDTFFWRDLRLLRNTIAHDYMHDDVVVLVDYTNQIFEAAQFLMEYWRTTLIPKIEELKSKAS